MTQDEREAVDDAHKLAAEAGHKGGKKRGEGGGKANSHRKKKLSKIQKVAEKWTIRLSRK